MFECLPSIAVKEQSSFEPAAILILHAPNGFRIELSANASNEFLQNLIGVLAYAK